MTVRFTTGIDVAAPIDAVFDMARDITLHMAAMTRYRERAVDGVTEGPIGLGETVSWKARHFGITWRMTSLITECEPPGRFTDQQVRGPFKRFSHQHEFIATDDGTTIVDHVEFDAPAGPLGRLVERLVLGRYIQRLIDERNAHLKAHAEAVASR